MAVSKLSKALDAMFERPEGLYGSFESIPVISQAGHVRRVELLDRLDIGDIRTMTVVDFGMGSWGFGSVYAKLQSCAKAIGMDVSNAALRMTHELVKNTNPPYAEHFETHQSDGMDLPLGDSSVDLVFSGESIEHVKFPPRYLSEIHRILRDGGQLVITTPNRDAVRYREQDEEYCTSPEHFWLFNTEELIGMISEFFQIVEIYGFNGSFGSHEEDRAVTDRAQAEVWSQKFETEPEKATGVVLRARKRPGVSHTYRVTDIAREAWTITGTDTYLPLEFGLEGLLLDRKGTSVAFDRPPSDGIVCRFWSHLWSGHARIEADGLAQELDLYTKVPGWQNWASRRPTRQPTSIRITPTLTRNAKAEAPQVIFYEAFTFDLEQRVRRPIPSLAGSSQLQATPQALDVPGYGFARYHRIVSTTVFHWFTETTGNLRGPWPPPGGRAGWDGSVMFWREQIKQMMLGNIDAIYLHLIPTFEEQRITFFRAYAELRREGWDVPKLAPYLDPFGTWAASELDLATGAGKDAFVAPYLRFFCQYFADNTDSGAASYLFTVDGRLALATWWVSLLQNVQSLTRAEVEQRLRAEFGGRIPQLEAGIWMITTALIDPDLTFTDERAVMFSGYAYAIHSVHAGIDVWHVQPGYWDQNIRKPGYFLPRDGGNNYRRAWDIVAANMPYINRVYVESWNEYDEGSGIYAAAAAAPFADPALHTNTDTFSHANDPYEYVLTTAEGASRINGLPEYDAKFVWHQCELAGAGREVTLTVVARNTGNRRWTSQNQVEFCLQSDGQTVGVHTVDDGFATAKASHRGIVRGQPLTLRFQIGLNEAVDMGRLTLSLMQGGRPFGERLVVTVPAAAAPPRPKARRLFSGLFRTAE